MILSTKEKEKRVLEYLEQNKSYREIQDLYHISSRDISFIVKKTKEKKDKEEEKKIQTSLTSKAYKLYRKGKNPLYVATTLGIGASEAKKLFEAIKISTNLPKIKEEYSSISSQLRELRDQRDSYYSHNNFLINKNLELQDGLSLTRNKIKEHITKLLKQKDSYIRLSIMTILKIIKDPEKEILLNNNNLRSSDQKISEMVAKFHDTISETIVHSIINSNNNNYNYNMYNNQEKI
jgi:hypothetical protein